MATRYFRNISLLTDYTQTEENTLATTLTGQPSGSSYIYNTTIGNARVWNGTSFETIPPLTAVNIPLVNTTDRGAVIATGTPTGKFLKDDNTWTQAFSGVTKIIAQPTQPPIVAGTIWIQIP